MAQMSCLSRSEELPWGGRVGGIRLTEAGWTDGAVNRYRRGARVVSRCIKKPGSSAGSPSWDAAVLMTGLIRALTHSLTQRIPTGHGHGPCHPAGREATGDSDRWAPALLAGSLARGHDLEKSHKTAAEAGKGG